MKAYKNQFIGGEWRIGTGERELENRNPYTGELLYTYRGAGLKDVDDAYRAAEKAQKEWEKVSPAQKREMLERLIEAIVSLREDIYSCLTEEGGSTRAKVNFEFYTSIEFVREALAFPLMMDGKIMPSNMPGKDNYIVKSPKGVIGVIAPWNVPLVLAMRSVVPAVAVGNAVVLKPATDTPASAFLVAEVFEKAGFPKGLVNVVAGPGSEIGDAFVSHPIPALISFTGSTEVGRRVGRIATEALKDVSLELGGNNAMLVLCDADVEQAARAAVFGAFFNQGQVCMAINRIIVEAPVYDAFVEAFVAGAKALKAGDPADSDTFIGPIINPAQVASIEGYIKATIDADATVALRGKTEGQVIHPWIFTNVTNDMPAAANEVFGPSCCIMKAENEQDAIDLANDSAYGLSGSVFTADLYHGMQVARQIKSGMVHVNDQSINDEPHIMFGGEKASGLGRFNGQWVVDKFTTEKWISVQTERRIF